MMTRVAVACLLWITTLCGSVSAQVEVRDIFGRSLNSHGIDLVDWDGYLANPLIKFYLLAPTNAALPGTASLMADGERLYFGTPSEVSTAGPNAMIDLPDSNAVPVGLSIFPAHNDPDAAYTLTIIFTGADNVSQTNTVPIHVIDEDTHRTNDFVVTLNFDRDLTGLFSDGTARAIATQAANDWTYFFTGMNLDSVPAGAESTYIWSNNYDGGYYFVNTNAYTGFLLYAYGTTNASDTSGGEGNFNGEVQTSAGIPLSIKRSGGFEANALGNYNTLGWLFLTNDSDWLDSDNFGDETNDFFSIAHHEIGHALIFNEGHPGFETALQNGAFTSAAVTNYYGGPVPVDPSNDHLTGVIDPESGQGAFGWEYYGDLPRKRWVMTKIDLLCAQEAGYTLRPTSAFMPFVFATNALPAAAAGVPFTNALIAAGGIPIYDWTVISGSLPPGLSLDPFTGAITGLPAANGIYNFTVRVRDYHESDVGLAQRFTLTVVPRPKVQLSIAITGTGPNSRAQILFSGTAGQSQIVEASTNLEIWEPVMTNTFVTNSFEWDETNWIQFPYRFYRSRLLP